MEKRYRALKIIAGIYKFFAYIVLIIGVILSFGNLMRFARGEIYFWEKGGIIAGLVQGGLTLIITFFIFISLLALAESIYVIIDIEENTRKSALSVSKESKEGFLA